MLVCQWAMVESCICWSGSGQWFSLAGSTVTVGQRTRSSKCVSDNVSVSGMVPSSKAFTYLIDCVGHPLRNTAGVCTNKMFKILLPYCQYSPSNNLKNIRATRLPNHTRTEHEIKRTLLGWTYPEACSRPDVPTRPDVPRRLFATVKPLRKSAGIPKQPGFEHLPQEAQPRLVCVLASLELNSSS